MSAAQAFLQGGDSNGIWPVLFDTAGRPEGFRRSRAAILLGMAQHSGHEVEIKLPVADLAAIRRRLRALGARAGRRFHEANVLFDTGEQSLRHRGLMLRLRVERPAGRGGAPREHESRRALLDSWLFPERRRQPAIVTMKAPPSSHPAGSGPAEQEHSGAYLDFKVRREIEFDVPDAVAFREVVEALGYRPSFYYEKIRTVYRLPRLHHLVVSLDETPVGLFLELEGPPAAIERARTALGYRAQDTILLSYGSLYTAQCAASGVRPGDMLF
jgi:adenylate cyclase class 2